MTLVQKSPISSRKAEYEGCATWCIPRGVSSHHVFRRAFGDALYRRENVRHATLFLSAQGGMVEKQQAQRKGRKNENRNLGSLTFYGTKDMHAYDNTCM